MKRISMTLTALLAAVSLSVTAQAATTNHSKTTKSSVKSGTHKATAKKTGTKHYTKGKKASMAKHHTSKKSTNTNRRSGEVNMDIPADLKINESSNNNTMPSTNNSNTNNNNTNNMPNNNMNQQPASAPRAVVVPSVSRVVATGPATQSTSVTPVNKNTVKRTVTTSVPVTVQTTPAVVVAPQQ